MQVRRCLSLHHVHVETLQLRPHASPRSTGRKLRGHAFGTCVGNEAVLKALLKLYPNLLNLIPSTKRKQNKQAVLPPARYMPLHGSDRLVTGSAFRY